MAQRKKPTTTKKTTAKPVAKKKPTTTKKVDKKTAELTLTKAVKYIYPEEMLGQGAEAQSKRKGHRQKIRNQIKKLAAAVTKAPNGTGKKRAELKLKKYESANLA